MKQESLVTAIQQTVEESPKGTATTSLPLVTGLLCCDFISRTMEGKYNLLGIFDRLLVGERAHQFWLYTRLINPCSGTLHIIGINPDGSVGVDFPFDFDHPPDADRTGVIELPLPFQVEPHDVGTHRFRVVFNDTQLSETELIVDSLPPIANAHFVPIPPNKPV